MGPWVLILIVALASPSGNGWSGAGGNTTGIPFATEAACIEAKEHLLAHDKKDNFVVNNAHAAVVLYASCEKTGATGAFQ